MYEYNMQALLDTINTSAHGGAANLASAVAGRGNVTLQHFCFLVAAEISRIARLPDGVSELGRSWPCRLLLHSPKSFHLDGFHVG